MGPEYVNDVKDCFAIVKALNQRYAISKSVPRWMQAFTPAEREIQEGLDFLNALGDVQGEGMALHYRTAFGGILRAVTVKRAVELSAAQRSDTTRLGTTLAGTIAALQKALSQVETLR